MLIESKQIQGIGAELFVYESLPFSVSRLFCLRGDEGVIRGEHAHRKCRQALYCVDGAVKLSIDNGNIVNNVTLNNLNRIYVLETYHWLKIDFMKISTIIVLCEFNYDEEEYIRSYDDFLKEVKV